MTTQPTPLPPTVAELCNLIFHRTNCMTDAEATRALEELCRRAADPAPVADEAAIEKWRKLATSEQIERPKDVARGSPVRALGYFVSEGEIEDAVRLMRAAPRNDEGRLRKLREEMQAAWLACIESKKQFPVGSGDRRECQAEANAFQSVCFGIDKLLAESPAGDAGEPSCKREYDAMVKLIRDSHNGYDHAARKELGMEEPASAIVALHDLIKEQKSLEGYEVRDLRREVDDLRARLQAAEAELDEKAELLDKVIYDAEEFSGKLSDILDKNLVPDGEPLARVKEAIDMLTETILERDKLEAERDAMAKERDWERHEWPKQIAAALHTEVGTIGSTPSMVATAVQLEHEAHTRCFDRLVKTQADLAAAQKERDVAVTGARDFRAAWEREKRWREDDRAAAKAEGARAVVEVLNEALDVLAGVLGEKNSYTAIVDLRDAKLRAAQPQPTTAEPATNGREGDDVLREFLDYSKDFSRDEKLDSGLCALVVLVRRALEGKP